MSNFFYNPYGITKDQITTTTENAADGFGKKKLAYYNPAVVYRSTSITSQTIQIDLGSVRPVSGVYIGNMNFVTGDTVSLNAGNAPGVALKTEDLTPFIGSGIINLHLIIPRDGPGGPVWNYRYYWIDITKAGGSYVQIGAFILFRNYSFYDLGGGGAEPVDPDVVKFGTDNISVGGRNLEYRENGYNNKIPYSGWIDNNVYVSTPIYQTPIRNLEKQKLALLKSISESNYHIWGDWSGSYFGKLKISGINDFNALGDIDKEKGVARMSFEVLDVIPKAVR